MFLSLHLSASSSSACSLSGFFSGSNKQLLNASSALYLGGVSNHVFQAALKLSSNFKRLMDFGLLENGFHNRKQQSGKMASALKNFGTSSSGFTSYFGFTSSSSFGVAPHSSWISGAMMSLRSSTQKSVSKIQNQSLFVKNHHASHWITGQPIIFHFVQFHVRCFFPYLGTKTGFSGFSWSRD